MDVKIDFSDIDAFLAQGKEEVRQVSMRVGQEAVQYAKDTGSYRNVTGNLRASNQCRVEDDKVIIENTAEYASDVEKRGHSVLTDAALYLEKRLREEVK